MAPSNVRCRERYRSWLFSVMTNTQDEMPCFYMLESESESESESDSDVYMLRS
jgi:hypothetical protein